MWDDMRNRALAFDIGASSRRAWIGNVEISRAQMRKGRLLKVEQYETEVLPKE